MKKIQFVKSFLFSIVAVHMLSSCSLFYVVKQGVYQFDLVAGAEPIERALRKDNLSENVRKKLLLIQDVRQFAFEVLKLKVNKNYKSVNLYWRNIIHNVSASSAHEFKSYNWWFPIIGSVPYKGFFDEQDAIKEERRLEKKGYDTLKRRVGGYSTLGFFADPVWPSMLNMSEESLVELIIHELAHATVYIPSQTTFNETFANFVGKIGAQKYFLDRYGPDNVFLKRILENEKNFSKRNQFFHETYVKLNKLYSSDLERELILQEKQKVLAKAQLDFQNLKLDKRFEIRDWQMINNAFLLSFKRYNQDENIIEQLYKLKRENFGEFLNEVEFYGRLGDPYASIKNRISTLQEKNI